MNSRLSNKVIVQIFRPNSCRFLSTKQNINKSSGTLASFDFHRKNENHFSCFSLSKHPFQKPLHHVPTPLHLNFQRMMSSESVAVKKLEAVESPALNLPQVEEVQEIATDTIPDFIAQVSQSNFVEFALQSLLAIHESSGLPWWASIALTAFMARTSFTLPLAVHQVRLMAKKEIIDLEMNDFKMRLENECNNFKKHYGWPEELATEQYTQALKEEWQKLMLRENCDPLKCALIFVVQIPLWVSFTLATRILCLPSPDVNAQETYAELLTGGFGWITNLTEADPYMALPLAVGLVNLTLIQVHQLFKVNRREAGEKWKVRFFQVLTVALVPIGTMLPAATNIYWLSSSLYGLLQAFLLNSSPIRRLFKIPATDPQLKKPYRFFFKNLTSSLRLANK